MAGETRTRLAIAYFVTATLALVWPLYGWFGNSIEPRVFGLPWSLTYVLLVIVANTLVLAALFYGPGGHDHARDDEAEGDDVRAPEVRG